MAYDVEKQCSLWRRRLLINWLYFVFCCLLSSVLCPLVNAAVMLGSNDWNSSAHDWTSMYDVGSITEQANFGGETGAEFTFTASAFPS